jgi:predicted ABC-type ATPase
VAAADRPACIWVLAGTNGAGKSSIGGAMLRQSGGDYFNPDEVARVLRGRNPALRQAAANALAWNIGLRQLDRAIVERRDYFFETTLGGRTISLRLEHALESGLDVRIWYVGLRSPERHIERVAARVAAGGHDIAEETIRERFDSSLRNVIRLLPNLTELKVFDNSTPADPASDEVPVPQLLLHWCNRQILAPRDLRKTPEWAKPIVAQAIKHAHAAT